MVWVRLPADSSQDDRSTAPATPGALQNVQRQMGGVDHRTSGAELQEATLLDSLEFDLAQVDIDEVVVGGQMQSVHSVCHPNRFAALAEAGPVVHEMSRGSDTESCVDEEQAQGQSRQGRRRLSLSWNPELLHRDARAAEHLLQQLAGRVGSVRQGSQVPRAGQQQRWSPFFVPLIWAASGPEDTTPMLELLMATLSVVTNFLEFHGGRVRPNVAAHTGWVALRNVFRSWSILEREDFTAWLRRQGFAGTQPGNHIPARAQEFILEEVCREDARVALLEACFVAAVMHMGRVPMPRNPEPVQGNSHPTNSQRGLSHQCWRWLDSSRCKEGPLEKGAHVKVLPAFYAWKVARMFRGSIARAPQGASGRRSGGAESRVEVVRIDPFFDFLHKPSSIGHNLQR